VTPAEARDSLDSFLAANGQTCELHRVAGATTRRVTLRAHVRDYRHDEVLGGNGLQTGDSRVIISMTEIVAAQWPNAATIAAATAGDPRIPIKGDRLVLSSGRVRIVQAAWPAPHVGDQVVRVEMTVR
jgi:hypothetical protein